MLSKRARLLLLLARDGSLKENLFTSLQVIKHQIKQRQHIIPSLPLKYVLIPREHYVCLRFSFVLDRHINSIVLRNEKEMSGHCRFDLHTALFHPVAMAAFQLRCTAFCLRIQPHNNSGIARSDLLKCAFFCQYVLTLLERRKIATFRNI